MDPVASPVVLDSSVTVMATAAFGLSVVSLSWQLWFALRVDRARLRVQVDLMRMEPPGIDMVAINVTNVGRKATVLQTANVVLGRPRRLNRIWPSRLRPKFLRRQSSVLNPQVTDIPELNTKLPCRLDVGDQATFYVRRDLVEKALRAAAEKRFYVLGASSSAGLKASRPTKLD